MKPLNRIQNKLLIAFLVIVLLPLVSTGLYGNWITSQLLQDNALNNARNRTWQHASQISAFLNNAKEDVLFLSELGSLQSLVEACANDDTAEIARWRQQVQSDFMAFSKRRRIYYQIRYLTEDGQEFVRIDSDGTAPRPIPENALQDKAHRYYFQETMQLAKGQVFVSPLDLNREHGEIERPYKPVIRYATPVFDARGTVRGIVITNIFADRFLDIVRRASSQQAKVLLVDQDGYYLVNPNTNLEWGGPSDLATGFSLKSDYPEAYPAILSGQPGDFIGENAMVFAPVYPDPNNPSYYWVIIHDEPRDTLFASVWNLRVTAASILILAIVVATTMAVVLARSLTAPIRALREGVERFGQGELTEPVPISTGDEIGQLAEAFNDMAVALDRSRTQRRNLLERLINVQEEERRVVAYDIHDGLIQRLVGARLQLSNFIAQRGSQMEKAEQSLQRGFEHLSAAIVEGRRLIEGLRPALLDDLGLAPALQELAQQVADEMGSRLEFVSNLSDGRLPPAVETTAFRIVQEALSNSRKHSRSYRLRVEIKQADGQLEIAVQDWGTGFDISCINQDHHCTGLVGMQERASLLGGRCQIESKPGKGTLVKSYLPLES